MKKIYGKRQIEETLRSYIRKRDWALLDCRINYFEAYQSFYGSNEADKVTQRLDQLIGTVLEEMGTPEDVLGYEASNDFIIITSEVMALRIKETLKAKFNSDVLTYYSPLDCERKYMLDDNGNKVAMMSLSIGLVSPNNNSFADIREII